MVKPMYNLLRRAAALALAMMLLVSGAVAELAWPDGLTPVQEQLRAYIARVNDNLITCGQQPINTLFELYPTYAALGITAPETPDVSDGVELAFTFSSASLSVLTLSVNDAARFSAIAASCMQAASADALVLEDALAAVSTYTALALAEPLNSYEEVPDLTPGTSPRTYFSYYPNQYGDDDSWLMLTLIFPLPGYADGMNLTTPAPEGESGSDLYEGYMDNYIPYDGLTHLEVFTTPTPEPGSPAGSL